MSRVADGAQTPRGVRGRAVLVTGASGFIGAHLCARLLAEGAQVHAVSRHPQPSGPVHWHRADLCNPSEVARVVDQAAPDILFHLASYVAGARATSAVLPMLQANCVAAVNVMSVASERSVGRLVMAGSLEEPHAGEPAPASPYAMAKWAASGYARMFHALYATPVVSARICMTYGPDQPDRGKLIPHVALSLLAGESPQLSSGRRLVDWIYIDDLVAGLTALATAQGIEGKTFDLGSGELHSISEVVRELYRLLAPDQTPRFGTLPDRPFESERCADVDQTTRHTGWQPRIDLREGLARTVDYYARVAHGEDVVNPLGLCSSRQTLAAASGS